MMNVAIRIVVLSIAMGAYFVWAFRGIENDPLESAPALLGFIAGFLFLTAVAVPVFAATAGKGKGNLAGFAFRCWLLTAGLVAVGWLVFYSRDPAAAGFFRENVIVGGLVLAGLVAVVNFALIRALEYLAPRKR